MIYADCNATFPMTTTTCSDIFSLEHNIPLANPNSIHQAGRHAQDVLETSRRAITTMLGAHSAQLIFTSGASESILLTLFNLSRRLGTQQRLLTSAAEHPAVREAIKLWFEPDQVCYLSYKATGELDFDHLEENILTESIGAIMLHAAHNESGILQNIQRLSELKKRHSLLLALDTTQWIGKIPFDFQSSQADFAVGSGHKFGALPGIGFLLARDMNAVLPLQKAGGQEFGKRGGTINVLGAYSMRVALEERCQDMSNLEDQRNAHQSFEQQLLSDHPFLTIVGQNCSRFPGTTLLLTDKISGALIQSQLDNQGVCVSTGSACSDRIKHNSHLLDQLQIQEESKQNVVRISFIPNQIVKEAPTVLATLSIIINQYK